MKSKFLIGLSLLIGGSAVASEVKMWVSVDQTDRMTCPSENCGKVGRLFFRESAVVHEIVGTWARVTKYYDDACSSGVSVYVDSGPNKCNSANGISNGKVAEWVKLEHLNLIRPDDPGAGATGAAKLVAGSDDFRLYAEQFTIAAVELIEKQICSETDFIDNGGWIKSTNRGEGIYFTYCRNKKIYLDVASGNISK
ncbi:MAG: hypothetical protein IPL47_11450 [Phyllobacteriaceae bacterium]|nr:hypothetical protein [Phyllobacteriaceae bacterium]